MNEEAQQRIHLGKREVVFGVNPEEAQPFLVCFCSYENPFSAPWPQEAVATEDYLEAMELFTGRVQEQIGKMREEQERFSFDQTPFTREDCLPCRRDASIIGKVVVLDAAAYRYEYRHSAYQLILAEGGNGAAGKRGRAVFGTCLADGTRGRWNREDVLGEIRPERMPIWAKEALAAMQRQTVLSSRKQPER